MNYPLHLFRCWIWVICYGFRYVLSLFITCINIDVELYVMLCAVYYISCLVYSTFMLYLLIYSFKSIYRIHYMYYRSARVRDVQPLQCIRHSSRREAGVCTETCECRASTTTRYDIWYIRVLYTCVYMVYIVYIDYSYIAIYLWYTHS